MALSATDFLHFLVAFALLLAVARGLGEAARRLGQPSVIGELLAGVVLGPSLLGGLIPGVSQALFPVEGPGAVPLQIVAQLGVVFLLLLSGMETNLDVIQRGARSASIVAAAGIVVPFVAGFFLALVMPRTLVARPDQWVVFALFVATAMSMSAIPVIVKILIDLDLMRRDVGQMILAAGMLTDTAGWFLLALVAGATSSEGIPLTALGVSFVGTAIFTVFLFTIGKTILRRFLAWVDHHIEGEDALLTAVLAVGIIGAAVTQALHVEAFLGAFLIGVQLSRVPRVHRKARAQLDAMTLGVFAPIFFATAGLRVELGTLVSPQILLVAVAVIVVACLGKLAGAFIGARLAGLGPWLSLALGAGLNARGAVEIIVATIGLDLGILTPAMYSIIVVMAVATSVLAPPSLRWTLRHVRIEPHEEERLRREALQARSFLHGVGRVLVPVRDGRYALRAAKIVAHLAGEREVDVVALHVRDGNAKGADPKATGAGATDALLSPADLPSRVHWEARSIEGKDDIVSMVLGEAGLGYDLLVLGAGARPASTGLFGGVTDRMIAAAPCAVFVLRLPPLPSDFQLRRVIFPTAGTEDDELAAEFAVALAKGSGADVVALHVVENHPLVEPFSRSSAARETSARRSVGEYATKTVQSLGELLDVDVRSSVHWHSGTSTGPAIVARAEALSGDLILLAARRHLAGSDLYCGRTIEYVLQHARCPVAVLFPAPAHGLDLI
ncbi:MAG: cation:proton antiporter [Chloroflexota bacterium]